MSVVRDPHHRDETGPGGSDRHPQNLPSFFVIGPPRTGTSWLHDVLSKQAALPSPSKETRFFDVHFHRGMRWYLSHFSTAQAGRPLGEVAPTYFASAEARERIAKLVPEARVVCIFRNPVERVLSLYRLKRAYGMIPWSLDRALVHDPELIESGKYASHLKAWQSALGENQILATFYEDLRTDPQACLDQITNFVKLPTCPLNDRHNVDIHSSRRMTQPRLFHWTRSATRAAEWFKARRMDRTVARVKHSSLARLFLGGGPMFEDPAPDVISQISGLFHKEVEELEVMLNRDLSEWKATNPLGTVSAA